MACLFSLMPAGCAGALLLWLAMRRRGRDHPIGSECMYD
jgi:hypothetical protein